MEAELSDQYRKYGTIIFSRCRRLLMDDTLAEQATQEIFIRLMRHHAAIASQGAMLEELYRLTAQHCHRLSQRPANPSFLSAAAH